MKNIFKKGSQKIYERPEILIGIGITGCVASIFMASYATLKAKEEVDNTNSKTKNKLSNKEIIKSTYKFYLPTAIVSVTSIGMIIEGTKIFKDKNDNLLKSAYALTETLSIQNKLFKEFCSEEDIEKIKEKTKEIKNDKNGFKIGEIPKDNIDDKIICFESFSGSYLETSIKCIRDTERELNKRLIDEDYITLNEFLESLGHDGSEIGDKFRWSKEMDLYIDLDLDARISEKGEFVLVINHNIEPVYCGL